MTGRPPGRLLALVIAIAVALLTGLHTDARAPSASPAGQRSESAGSARTTSKDWNRLRSANFIGFGNGHLGALRRAVAKLEGFRQALLDLFPSLRLEAPTPTLVLAIRGEPSFSRFKPLDSRGRRKQNVGGYFMQLPDVNYIVLPPGSTTWPLRSGRRAASRRRSTPTTLP